MTAMSGRTFKRCMPAAAAMAGLLAATGLASGATVKGRLVDAGERPADMGVKFVPLSGPQALGTNTVLEAPVAAGVTNGQFRQWLVGGLYRVEFGSASRSVRILVPPGDTNEYEFNHCAALATNLGTFVWTNNPGALIGGEVLTNDYEGAVRLLSSLAVGGPISGDGGGLTNVPRAVWADGLALGSDMAFQISDVPVWVAQGWVDFGEFWAGLAAQGLRLTAAPALPTNAVPMPTESATNWLLVVLPEGPVLMASNRVAGVEGSFQVIRLGPVEGWP